MFFRYIYLNGNYIVNCTEFGKTRKYTTLRIGENFKPNFPDSIDLKITNKCSIGCSFCHESSSPNGKSFSLENTKRMLEILPGGIEIAIGGGNIFDCFDDFLELLNFCKLRNFYTRATINIQDLLDSKKLNRITDCISGNRNDRLLGAVGISIMKFSDIDLFINELMPSDLISFRYHAGSDLVFHIILGIYPVEDFTPLLDYCISNRYGILILGLKQFGRASNLGKPSDIEQWKQLISKTIYKSRISDDKLILGLDNLAIEQIDLHNMLTTQEWEGLFLGNEFSHSMYVDAVEETFSATSRSPKEERVSWGDVDSIIDFFKSNHKSWS